MYLHINTGGPPPYPRSKLVAKDTKHPMGCKFFQVTPLTLHTNPQLWFNQFIFAQMVKILALTRVSRVSLAPNATPKIDVAGRSTAGCGGIPLRDAALNLPYTRHIHNEKRSNVAVKFVG